MKKIGIITAAACAFALCLALAGCGGSSTSSSAASAGASSTSASTASSESSASASQASAASTSASSASASSAAASSAGAASATAASADSKFIGEWRMLEGSVDGTAYSASDLATANNMGMGVTLTFNADGTFLMIAAGDENDTGTWTEADGTATMDGAKTGKTYECVIDGTGIMKMTADGVDCTYSKK